MNRQLLTSKSSLIDRSSSSHSARSKILNRSTFQHMRPLVIALLAFVVLGGGFRLHAQQQEVGKRRDLGEFNLTLVGDNIIYTQATVHQGNPKFMAAVKEIRTG